jgi:hypothetical protein
VSPASRADFAAAAAAVLVDQREGIFELAGDTDFTLTELAAEIARQAGTPVRYVNLTEDAFRDLLMSAGLPQPYAELLADSDAGLAKGALFDESCTLSMLVGRPTMSMESMVTAALAGKIAVGCRGVACYALTGSETHSRRGTACRARAAEKPLPHRCAIVVGRCRQRPYSDGWWCRSGSPRLHVDTVIRVNLHARPG